MVVLRSKKNVSKTRAKTRSRSRANNRSRTKTNVKSKSKSRTRKFMRGGATAPPKFNTDIKPDLGSGSVNFKVKTVNPGEILLKVASSNPPSNATLQRQKSQRLVSGVSTFGNEVHLKKIAPPVWQKTSVEAQQIASLGQKGVGAAATFTGLPKDFGEPLPVTAKNSEWVEGWPGSRPTNSGTGVRHGRVTDVGALKSGPSDIFRIVRPRAETNNINTSVFAEQPRPAQKVAEQLAEKIQVRPATTPTPAQAANNIVYGFDSEDLKGYQQPLVETMKPQENVKANNKVFGFASEFQLEDLQKSLAPKVSPIVSMNVVEEYNPDNDEYNPGVEKYEGFGSQVPSIVTNETSKKIATLELGPFGFKDNNSMNAKGNFVVNKEPPPAYNKVVPPPGYEEKNSESEPHPYLKNSNLAKSDVEPKDTGYVRITDNNSDYERQFTPFNSRGKRGLSGTTEEYTTEMNKEIRESIGDMENKRTVLIEADNAAAKEKGKNYVYTRRSGNNTNTKKYKGQAVKGREQWNIKEFLLRQLYKLSHPSNSKKNKKKQSS